MRYVHETDGSGNADPGLAGGRHVGVAQPPVTPVETTASAEAVSPAAAEEAVVTLAARDAVVASPRSGDVAILAAEEAVAADVPLDAVRPSFP